MSMKSFSLLRRQSGTIPRVYSRAAASVLAILAACICSLTGARAMAWGELHLLSTKWRQAFLEYPAIKYHRINFCIELNLPTDRNGNEINRGHFSVKSISEQTKMALTLWLNAADGHGLNGHVKIRRLPFCAGFNVNLKIIIGPSDRWWAITNYEHNEFGYHAQTYINTNSVHSFQWNSELMQIPTYDFQYLVHKYLPGMTLPVAMDYAYAKKMDLYAFGSWANAPAPIFGYSSYPTLIHEMGHAFGLCDTGGYPSAYDCDPKHVSVPSPLEQPVSVMNDGEDEYFYLKSDDIAGVRDAFSRYSWLTKSANKRPK